MLQNHSLIRVAVFIFMNAFSYSLFSQCDVIVSNITHPSNCNSSNGGFRVVANNPTPSCKRKIHVIKDNILLFSGEGNLTVGNLAAGDYLVIGESGCGCPVNHSQVVTLNGGSPTVLIPRIISGNIPMEAREVIVCRGGSTTIGVQPLGTSNLVLVSPNGQSDNTPDGSSFWNLNNLQPQNAGVYTIKYTNNQGCTSQTTIMVRVSTFNVDVHQSQIVCQGQPLALTANTFNAAQCAKPCSPSQDSLLVRWTLDQCNALNQTQQNSYAEFVPAIFKRQCTDVTASTVYRNAGEHSCTPVVNSYAGDVGMCFMAMDGCDLANYNANNALRFNVTLKPSQVGGLSKLSFREQSPLNWVTTNGSTGINNYNTKYLIRVYKDGLLVYQDNNKTTERTWNEEVFNFSGNPLFNIDTTTTFSFELFGYCSVPSGGNMSGWEVDDIKIFGSCCTATPSDSSVKYVWSTGDTTKSITFNSLGTSFYKVTATDCNGCMSIDSAKITVIPNPTATITGKTIICQGDTATLTAIGGSKFLWSNGSTNSSIRVHTAGVFSVTVTDGSNCTAVASVTTSIAPNPVVTITGDSEICAGDTTIFTASGGVSYSWSTGATTSSILASTELGYQVTVTDANGCKGTNAVQLIINPNASPLISGDLSICNGESTLLTASEEASYLWSTGATSSTIMVSPVSTTAYTVTTTSVHGCTGTATVTVVVNPRPQGVITGDINICAGESTTLTVTGGASYAWANGTIGDAITVSPSVNTLYVVTVTSSAGCTSTAWETVVVNPLPMAAISGTTEICPNTSTTLTASGGRSYAWSNGATTNTIEVNTAGTYTVSVTSDAGCIASASDIVTIKPDLTVTISGDTDICDRESTTLTASGGSTYLWSDGSTNATLNIAPTTTSTYTVSATSTDGCVGTANVTVVVNPRPQGVITGDINICSGESTTLTVTGGASYAWANGTIGDVITVSPLVNTLFVVTVTSSAGCTSTAWETVVVNPLPMAAISGTTEICPNTSTTLTASGGGSYAWSNGATTNTIEVNTAGTYTVSVTSDAGCVASASAIVTIRPDLTVTFSGDTDICDRESTTLTASGGSTYLWSDGSTNATLNIAPTVTSTYTVTATSTDGCVGSASVTVVVNPRPQGVITGDINICARESTTLTVTGGASYVWANGTIGDAITVSPLVNTLYVVTVTSSAGCTSTAWETVVVNPLPMAAISGTTEICPNTSTTLTASGVGSYAWSNGATTNTIEVNTAGTYTVSVTSDAGCHATASATVTIKPDLTVIIAGDTDICDRESTTLTASGGSTYLWSDGSTNANLNIVPSTTSTYTVTATSTDGCVGTASVTVVVNPRPQGVITGHINICAGESTTLTVTGGASYAWANGTIGDAITVSPLVNTLYVVTVTSSEGCTSTAWETVVVNPLPIAAISGTTEICPNTSTTLTASGGGSYAWSNGATTNTIEVNTAGTYTVFVTSDAGCVASASATVTIRPDLMVTISGDKDICDRESTSLTASGGATYLWSDGSTNATLNIVPSTTSTYTVTATSTDGCVGTASVTVVINPRPQGVITGHINICAGESTTLTVTGGASYVWANGTIGDAITVSPLVNTLYVVTVTSSAGCTSTAWQTVVVNPLPMAAISGTTEICPNTSTTLTASGVGSYAWSNGATTNTIEVNTAGTYAVSVTSDAGCVASASATVTVTNSPNIVITGDTNLCEGESSTLTINGSGTYLWSTGATAASISVNMSGTYSCTVTNQGGCTSTAAVSVVVNLLPIASITGHNILCEGESTILNGQGGSSYLWSTGSTNSALIVSSQGVYTLTVTDIAGCTDVASFTVLVNPRPTVNITGQNLVCIGGSTQLTANGASTYLWTTSATTDNITVTSSSTYSVTGTDANGCTSTATTTVQFVPPPNAAITGDLNICVGDSTLLTASGASYFWNTGATTSSIYVKETGIYQVVVLSAPGCGDTVSVQVNVYPYTVARILADSSVCAGTTVFMTGTGGGTYLWSTGETTATISKIATTPQTYSLTVTNAGNCSSVASVNINTKPIPSIDVSGFDELCQGQSTILIANGFSNSDCPGECVSDSSLLIKWTLDSCMADLVSGSNAIYQEFKGTVSDSTCMPVYADTIYRLNGEIHSCTQGINGSIAMCFGTQDVCDPRKLDFAKALRIGFSINPSQVGQITHMSFYERSPIQYSWINGATGMNNFVERYAIRVSKNGKFIYQQYDIASSRNWLKKSFDFTNIPNFKTQDSAYYLVEIVPYCRVNNGADVSVWDIDQVEVFGGCCEGNTSDVTTYAWSNGNTSNSISVMPSVNTIYTVTATDCCGCKATKDVRVLISNLQLDAGANQTITLGQQASITPNVQSLSGCFEIELKYRWSNSATTKNISVSPTANTTYYLSVEDCHGCIYEDSITINVTSNKLVTFPNPARDLITVVGPIIDNSLIKVRLLRMDGQLILKRNIDIIHNEALNFEFELPESLTSGAYILEVDNGFTIDRSIIVVQK